MSSKFWITMALALTLLISGIANAQNKILKVSEKSKKVGISISVASPLKVGDMAEVPVANDESCKIKIVRVTAKIAIGNASCDFLEDLKGQDVKVVSKASGDLDLDTELDSGTEESQSKSKHLKDQAKKTGIGFSVYYSLADSIKSSGTIGSSSFTETDKTDPQLGLSLHYDNIVGHHFGSFVSLDYELERKIKSGTGTIGGLSYNGSPTDSTFSFINLTTNIGYGISNEFLVYLGINYPVLITAKNSGADYRGSIGAQGGLGYRFTEIVQGSLEYRLIRAKGTVSGTSPFTGQSVSGSDDLQFDSFLLRLGFNF